MPALALAAESTGRDERIKRLAASGASLPSVEQIHAEQARRRFLREPLAWIRERLQEHVWSKQAAIVESVRDHRRTAVRSCHESGKSYIVARIAAWWLSTHVPGEAFVVSTAPSFSQVRAILWREIRRAHAKGRLPGHLNQTEWHINGELVGFGRKPDDLDPAAFQGIHARYVLVILDEACGIESGLWEAADTLIANEGSRIVAIGNPDDPATEFSTVCTPGSGWNVIGIDAFETPNFTGEPIPPGLDALLIGPTWVEEKRRKWGEASPLWIAKVRGQFPEISEDTLIPIAWVRAAQERSLEPVGVNVLGVDVARYGSDKTTGYHRRGDVIRKRHEGVKDNLMATTGHVVRLLRETGATCARIDDVGMGGGVVDRLDELKRESTITAAIEGVNVGEGASDPKQFANLRAELYWGLRERFEAGAIDLDPADDDLANELCAMKYEVDSRGRILIESKIDMKKRGLPSPDHADAVMLAFAPGEHRVAAASVSAWGAATEEFTRQSYWREG